MKFEVIPATVFKRVNLPLSVTTRLFDQTVNLNKKVITSVSSKSGRKQLNK